MWLKWSFYVTANLCLTLPPLRMKYSPNVNIIQFSNTFIFFFEEKFSLVALSLSPSLLPLLSPSVAELCACVALALVCTLDLVTLWCAATWFHSPPRWHRSNLQVCRGKTDEEIQVFISSPFNGFAWDNISPNIDTYTHCIWLLCCNVDTLFFYQNFA